LCAFLRSHAVKAVSSSVPAASARIICVASSSVAVKPFVAVNERVIANDAHGVGGRHVDDVWRITVRAKLLGTGQSGFKERLTANSCGTAVEREETVMQYEDVALVDPDRLFHFESACNVLR
jgi:hypothetical protein